MKRDFFEVGSTNRSCTKDIWMNKNVKKIKDKNNNQVNLIFMDTEVRVQVIQIIRIIQIEFHRNNCVD